MAQLVIEFSSNELKQEALDAFVLAYSNPDSLTAEDLTILHTGNFIMQHINNIRKNSALQEAIEGVDLVDSLT